MEKHKVQYIVIGSGLKASSLKKILQNSYTDNPKSNSNIDGYEMDKTLSGKRAQVYHNKDKNHTIINHRGTRGINDVITDFKLMLGKKDNNRFKHGKKITDEAIKKYTDSDITLTGHSLSGQIVKEANKKHNKETIVLNPAITPHDLLDKQKSNETIIRSKADPISILHNLQPYKSKNKTINIEPKTANPLKEHSTNILDRLDNDYEF